MPLIGTAGHVDHGKSTLVERITGRDPDRWAEEKRRGLTIDLGFAWAELPGGITASFVDVPGHERFVKNMLSGIEAIDSALFVVAADEGWMPQTEEHLAVLDLLDVPGGVIALTKADLVDGETLDIAMAEIAERVTGSVLERVPVMAVSAITGEGIEPLLEQLAMSLPDRPPDTGRPRLWVDRSFSASGAGTIVTGTLVDSTLSVGDIVEIHPQTVKARIRGIQTHETKVAVALPGTRVALNLTGVETTQVGRGDMIGRPGEWDMSARFSARVRTARYAGELERRGGYQIHIGSSAHEATITGLSGDVIVILTEVPIPMSVGDRFILRDTGRMRVVGGGRVLDPAPGRTGRALEQAGHIDPDAARDEIATSLLERRGRDLLTRIAAHSRGGAPVGAAVAGDVALAPSAIGQLTQSAVATVDRDHSAHPLRPGMPMASLATTLGVGIDVVELIVERCDALERVGPDVARAGRSVAVTPELESAWERARARLAESLAVPAESDLGVSPELIALKLRSGDLVRVAPGLVYLPGQIEALTEHMAALGEEFTVAQLRDATRLSRKYVVPFLEWADKKGLTVRRGDIRRLR